jgi:two-component system LytT family response regulator
MPGFNGIDVLHKLGDDYRPAIIFTTAYEQYAVKAFEVKAIDYLLKPFDRTRFDEAFSRAHEYIQNKESDFNQLIKKLRDSFVHLQQSNKEDHLTRILIKETKKIFFVKTNEVYWFEASGDYVTVHLEKKSHLINQSLNSLETHLNSSDFVRIHRSYIVNVNYIAEFEPHFNSEYFITLKNNARLKLSRTYRDRLGFLFTDLFDRE